MVKKCILLLRYSIKQQPEKHKERHIITIRTIFLLFITLIVLNIYGKSTNNQEIDKFAEELAKKLLLCRYTLLKQKDFDKVYNQSKLTLFFFIVGKDYLFFFFKLSQRIMMRWIDNTKKKIGSNTLLAKASLGNLSNTKGKSITTNINNTFCSLFFIANIILVLFFNRDIRKL